MECHVPERRSQNNFSEQAGGEEFKSKVESLAYLRKETSSLLTGAYDGGFGVGSLGVERVSAWCL